MSAAPRKITFDYLITLVVKSVIYDVLEEFLMSRGIVSLSLAVQSFDTYGCSYIVAFVSFKFLIGNYLKVPKHIITPL